MVETLSSVSPIVEELVRLARLRGMGFVWRAQARSVTAVTVHRGRAEEVAISRGLGQGVQVCTEDGRTALGSRDGWEAAPAVALFERTAETAARARALGVSTASPSSVASVRATRFPEGSQTLARVDTAAVTRTLIALEREIVADTPGIDARLSFVADLDAWRIAREDGTDVSFAMPRCVLRVSVGARTPSARHLVSAHVSAPLPSLIEDDAALGRFLRRARAAAGLARSLPDAPRYPSGPRPMVIDYALAKGLAHEAFGHAAEADGFRTSVLAKDGRFRAGKRVGAAHVSIIDEPVEHDHAWQPYSADGEPRLRTVIVDRGRLHEALADRWSADSAGVRCTAAGRAESYRSAPLPRMTNIRIEAEGAVSAPGTFEDYGPDEVRDLLTRAGVFRTHREIAYLSGYSGGQVNPATGDFVFQCKAIWSLGENGIALHRPAIFSGSMFGALGAIREAFGPLLLDAIGTCGKWGQSVPSSGGSHWFLVLDADPSVRLGGG